jgi:stage II sporulation protein AA (anti-sigma F factor antagonist)
VSVETRLLISEEREADVLVLAVAGRVDSTASAELESRLFGPLGAPDTRVVVDLRRVEYISSAGLRVFLRLLARLREAKGQLVLCSMAESVREVFELAGFMSIFAVEPSRAQAVARLAQP